jgi:hypothetical protein
MALLPVGIQSVPSSHLLLGGSGTARHRCPPHKRPGPQRGRPGHRPIGNAGGMFTDTTADLAFLMAAAQRAGGIYRKSDESHAASTQQGEHVSFQARAMRLASLAGVRHLGACLLQRRSGHRPDDHLGLNVLLP